MKDHKQRLSCRLAPSGAAVLAGALLFLCLSVSAEAQTITVLHSFGGGGGGSMPTAGVTLDRVGNLYGAAMLGGEVSCGCGTVLGDHAVGQWLMASDRWAVEAKYLKEVLDETW